MGFLGLLYKIVKSEFNDATPLTVIPDGWTFKDIFHAVQDTCLYA